MWASSRRCWRTGCCAGAHAARRAPRLPWGLPHGSHRGPDLPQLRKELELQRSEEHTSELQSRFDLVCRLLLEKKKKLQHKSATELSPAPSRVGQCHVCATVHSVTSSHTS